MFHLAAKVDLDRDRDGSIHSVNVDGTRVVAAACLARKIRMVHCSSHHALERRPLEEPLDESKPLALDEPCVWGELTSVPMPKRVLPLWVGWGMVPFTIAFARLTGKPALFTPGVLRASVSNRVVSHAKATRELGFEPRSVKDSLSGALAFYRAAGWVGGKSPLSSPASPARTPQ